MSADIESLSIRLGEITKARYRNWKGDVEERSFIPVRLFFGTFRPFHNEPQWLLLGYDIDKKDFRTYSLRGFEEFLSSKEGESK